MVEDNHRKLLGSMLVAVSALVVLVGFSLYQATRWVPPFYCEKLELDGEALAIGESEMDQRLLNLQSDILQCDDWQALFSDAQINGWLAGGLQEKFPRAIPSALSAPRVAISSDEAKLACQYTEHTPPTVISLVMDVFLTDQQNVIGLRLKSTRFGAVPGFMDEVVQQMTLAARRCRIPVKWTQSNGDPVALVSISPTIIDRRHRMTLAAFELREGAIYVAGHTTAVSDESPRSAMRDRHAFHGTAARRHTTAAYPSAVGREFE